KFKHGTRRRALEYEKDWVKRWKQDKTFEKSVENRPADNAYVFYDGPPFITGVPHHGTLLSSIVKDAVPRYQTMKGHRVERVWGWDCHGLPAEVFTEKKLGIKDRRDIGTKISLEDYIKTARENMVQTSSLWNDTIDRIGRWVDMDHAYKTMDKEFMESIWWGFKTLYDKGKIYEGERVLMYCTRDATPLSKAEVTMDSGSYQDVTDPSVYVKFKLRDDAPKRKALKRDAKVLFVCHANVSRSQMGKAVYNSLTSSNRAKSAGVGVKFEHPEGKTIGERNVLVGQDLGIDKYESSAESALREVYDLDITDWPRQQMTPDMLQEYDLVVNLAERFQTPEWLRGHNVVWWDVKDPGIKKDESDRSLAAKKALAIIEDRVGRLIDGEIVDDNIDAKYLLAWTTTPWTLPANTAVGVGPKETYVELETAEGERLIMHKGLVKKVMQDEKHQPLEYKMIRELKGKELIGKSYEPLMGVDRGKNAHKIWEYPNLSAEEGTGIVHLAPAYGEEDFELAKKNGIPVVHVIDENGLYSETEWKGQNVWETNKTIAKALHERGIVWKIEYYRHSYPHCHRCGTRLMYRAHPSWFFDVQGQKPLMLAKNEEQITWFPEHLKHGRWEKNIEQAPDWNLSRDRFWATAMPVWEGTDKGGKK
ncbi:MAG TPA: class I tRNA ligase family protein, partial [Candidatus Saccharimonadaceae bacterium]|nr:class I tRNA ligase family protein [Candidatus Saccharimonadaceae bacterium]